MSSCGPRSGCGRWSWKPSLLARQGASVRTAPRLLLGHHRAGKPQTACLRVTTSNSHTQGSWQGRRHEVTEGGKVGEGSMRGIQAPATYLLPTAV